MRSRNIKPGYFKNEVLAECSPLARILFVGLWCYADREGRFEYRPKRIKIELLPYDDCCCDDLLVELEGKGFIERYTIDSHVYIQILSFSKHQNPHKKEKQSTIPYSEKPSASTVQEPCKDGTSHLQRRNKPG